LPTNPNKVETAQNHPVPGYALSNGLDGNGRIIAFVYPGAASTPDGSEIHVSTAQVDASVNATLLSEGHGYAAFYSSLPAELREHLRPMVIQARDGNDGLWSRNSGDPSGGAHVADLAALEQSVVWPKLFRRLQQFFASGRTNLAGFDAWLRESKDDRILVLDRGVPNRIQPGELGHLHNLITANGAAGTIRMELHADEFVVVEGTAEPSQPPRPMAASMLRIISAVVNPIGADRGAESVTILNTGAAAADLAGWSLTDARGSQSDVLPAQPLAAGDTLRVVLSHVQLGNDGDTILLLGPNGELGDRVAYPRDAALSPGTSVTFDRSV
jgi:hypothetical protein